MGCILIRHGSKHDWYRNRRHPAGPAPLPLLRGGESLRSKFQQSQLFPRHGEEQSDEAIQKGLEALPVATWVFLDRHGRSRGLAMTSVLKGY